MHALHVIIHLNEVADGLAEPIPNKTARTGRKALARRRAILEAGIKAAYSYDLPKGIASEWASKILEANQ